VLHVKNNPVTLAQTLVEFLRRNGRVVVGSGRDQESKRLTGFSVSHPRKGAQRSSPGRDRPMHACWFGQNG